MTVIRRLSKQLASQIAAGEVVERPASVVKELLENAVDAKASHILCEIKSAGKVLVRIRDNGVGIDKDDLPLALAPHATSKIYELEDLDSIQTLGFRGEALASIASVSKLTLTSKTATQEHAFSVSVEGPEQEAVVIPAAHPNGTTIDVCELFFNTPARRRFLKSDRTEFLKIKDTFVKVALAHSAVAFDLISDDKVIFKVPKSKLQEGLDHQRIATLLGQDYLADGIRVYCEDPNLKIEGMILEPPPVEASLPDQIYVFLNGRPIADKLVNHAIREAFNEALPKNTTIRCVLYLHLDPKVVDVNVHPRKDEVRFHESMLVHDLIVDSIVSALRNSKLAKSQSQLDFAEDSFSPIASSNYSNFQSNSKQNHEALKVYQEHKDNLPAFPQGKSVIIDPNAYQDRGSVIIKKNPQGGSSALRADYQSALQDQDRVNYNINLFKSQVNSATIGTNANLNLQTKLEHYSYQSKLSFLDVVEDHVALVKEDGKYYFVNLALVQNYFDAKAYIEKVKLNQVDKEKLTIPFMIKLDENLIKGLKIAKDALSKCGFELKCSKVQVELARIPAFAKGCNLTTLSTKALPLISSAFKSILDGNCPWQLAMVMAKHQNKTTNLATTQELLVNLDTITNLSSVKNAYLEVNLKQLAQKFGGMSEE